MPIGLIAQTPLNPATLINSPTDSWPTYNGDYSGRRHSSLTQINTSNVKNLTLAWVYRAVVGDTTSWGRQANSGSKLKSTPILFNGLLFITMPDRIWALDAVTGREVWRYAWRDNTGNHVGNRGVGIYGKWLFFLTPDDYLVSLNATDGKERWKVPIADVKMDFFGTTAPMIIGNHVIVAPGNDDNIRAYIESRDPETGALQWRWWVTPEPGQPGSETWLDADTMMTGGGFPWTPGTYDPELNLYYFGTGNGVPMNRPPHPSPTGEDSLYTASIVALNPDTGKLAWAFQTTPHDTHDYDAAQTTILFDGEFNGQKRKLLAQINRNGYYFLLDRATGNNLLTTKYVAQTNWAKGVDAQGHPIPDYTKDARPEGTLVSPNALGTTNWFPPTFDPKLGLLFINASRSYSYLSTAGFGRLDHPTQHMTLAIDYKTGKIVWEHELGDKSGPNISGLLSTAGGVLFGGDTNGSILAMDSAAGRTLWHANVGQVVMNGPISYELNNRQYVAFGTADLMYAFALPHE